MHKNYERGVRLLDALGSKAARPKPFHAGPATNGVCKYCNAMVTWATAPTGKRVPLDVHPEGDLVVVAGNAVECGPLHNDLRRYVTHFAACRRERKETP